MIGVILLIVIGVELEGIAWWLAHDPEWSSRMLGVTMTCASLGALCVCLALSITIAGIRLQWARWRAVRRLGVVGPLSAYVLVEDPQPTL